MSLAQIGSRFLSFTNTSWNEKYKKKYGELK
jgi:hypothetical protein